MTELKLLAQKLKKNIDLLTLDIATRIKNHIFDNVDEMLIRRHNLISELINLPLLGAERETLLHYLKDIRNRDQIIMDELKEKQALVKDSAVQTDKLKDYII